LKYQRGFLPALTLLVVQQDPGLLLIVRLHEPEKPALNVSKDSFGHPGPVVRKGANLIEPLEELFHVIVFVAQYGILHMRVDPNRGLLRTVLERGGQRRCLRFHRFGESLRQGCAPS